jgi:hypothetical protein
MVMVCVFATCVCLLVCSGDRNMCDARGKKGRGDKWGGSRCIWGVVRVAGHCALAVQTYMMLALALV